MLRNHDKSARSALQSPKINVDGAVWEFSVATPPIVDTPPSWQVLVGLFEPEQIISEFEQGSPILVLPNNDRHVEALTKRFENRPDILRTLSNAVLGSKDCDTNWYTFTDSRYDGIKPLEELHNFSPNLRLKGIEVRPVMSLDTVVRQWTDNNPELSDLFHRDVGRLWLQCKLPASVVTGAVHMLGRVGELCWNPLSSMEECRNTKFEAWVENLESGLFKAAQVQPMSRHSTEVTIIWRLDPVRVAEQRQQKLQTELAELKRERQELVEKLDEQERANLELTDRLGNLETKLTVLGDKANQLEALVSRMETIASARLSELEAIRQEHESLTIAHQELRNERDRIQHIQDTLAAEKQELVDQLQKYHPPSTAANPLKGDLRVCMDTMDPGFGTLQMLVSDSGEAQIWEPAVASSLPTSKPG